MPQSRLHGDKTSTELCANAEASDSGTDRAGALKTTSDTPLTIRLALACQGAAVPPTLSRTDRQQPVRARASNGAPSSAYSQASSLKDLATSPWGLSPLPQQRQEELLHAWQARGDAQRESSDLSRSALHRPRCLLPSHSELQSDSRLRHRQSSTQRS